MYTRSYFTEDKKIEIPEKYDGNAFREDSTHPKDNSTSEAISNEETDEESIETSARSGVSSIFGSLPLSRLFSGLQGSFFKDNNLFGACKTIGTEEILIGAVALYLFFSKDGDRECAIMLLILLFIH